MIQAGSVLVVVICLSTFSNPECHVDLLVMILVQGFSTAVLGFGFGMMLIVD